MIKKINMEEIQAAYKKKGERIKDILDFIESGASAAEVFSESATRCAWRSSAPGTPSGSGGGKTGIRL